MIRYINGLRISKKRLCSLFSPDFLRIMLKLTEDQLKDITRIVQGFQPKIPDVEYEDEKGETVKIHTPPPQDLEWLGAKKNATWQDYLRFFMDLATDVFEAETSTTLIETEWVFNAQNYNVFLPGPVLSIVSVTCGEKELQRADYDLNYHNHENTANLKIKYPALHKLPLKVVYKAGYGPGKDDLLTDQAWFCDFVPAAIRTVIFEMIKKLMWDPDGVREILQNWINRSYGVRVSVL